jgi:hypothetical protein
MGDHEYKNKPIMNDVLSPNAEKRDIIFRRYYYDIFLLALAAPLRVKTRKFEDGDYRCDFHWN